MTCKYNKGSVIQVTKTQWEITQLPKWSVEIIKVRQLK